MRRPVDPGAVRVVVSRLVGGGRRRARGAAPRRPPAPGGAGPARAAPGPLLVPFDRAPARIPPRVAGDPGFPGRRPRAEAARVPSADPVTPTPPSEERAALRREVARQAWPVVFTMLLKTLMFYVDTYMISGVGPEAM